MGHLPVGASDTRAALLSGGGPRRRPGHGHLKAGLGLEDRAPSRALPWPMREASLAGGCHTASPQGCPRSACRASRPPAERDPGDEMEATSAASPLDLIPGGARAGPPEVGCHVGGGGPGSPGGALAASRHPPSLSRSYPPHAARLTPEAQTVTYRRRMGSDRCRTGKVTGSSPRTGLESWKRGTDRRSGRETQAGPAQRQSSVRRVCGPSAAGGPLFTAPKTVWRPLPPCLSITLYCSNSHGGLQSGTHESGLLPRGDRLRCVPSKPFPRHLGPSGWASTPSVPPYTENVSTLRHPCEDSGKQPSASQGEGS